VGQEEFLQLWVSLWITKVELHSIQVKLSCHDLQWSP
jgi:hypothetical protein